MSEKTSKRELVEKYLKSGKYTPEEIAKLANCTRTYVIMINRESQIRKDWLNKKTKREEIIKLLNQGYSIKEISQKVKTTKKYIYMIKYIYGAKKVNNNTEKKVLIYLKRGYLVEEIQDITGLTKQEIKDIANKHNIEYFEKEIEYDLPEIKCLNCHKFFKPKTKFNRLCPTCKEKLNATPELMHYKLHYHKQIN